MEQKIFELQTQLGTQIRSRRHSGIVPLAGLFWLLCLSGCTDALRINQIQFVGSHNSYKKAMSPTDMQALAAQNPAAAQSLDYAHLALADQLSLGLRKLELDVFYLPQSQTFPVGHVQDIDMASHCDSLRDCLKQVRDWSDVHPNHVPIWISFNAKDQAIAGLSTPTPFDEQAFKQLDAVVIEGLGDRLITPAEIKVPKWPSLTSARGKFILILDEQGAKRDLYWQGWQQRPLFTNAPPDHPAAAIMIVNDPEARFDDIQNLVKQGYMVRTRADADTKEARSGNTQRREAAFASGAQAISTDYYLPALRFGTGYQVKLTPSIRCNPVTALSPCAVTE